MPNDENTKNFDSSLSSPTKAESCLEISATIASIAPWIGGPISNVLNGISIKRKISRIDTCLKELSLHVEKIHNESTEKFAKTEDFEDLLEQTLKKVAEERNEEKRKLFGTFLLNNIASPSIEYDKRIKILKILGDLDLSHLSVLKALSQSPTQYELKRMLGSIEQTLLRRLPKLENNINEIILDLDQMRLTNNIHKSMRVTITGGGAADLRRRMTQFGKEFVSFLLIKN